MGEAPEWVRDAWIGVRLPLAFPRKRNWRGSGILSGPRTFLGQLWALISGKMLRVSGYAVNAKTAVDLLAEKNSAGAEWWRQNAPELLSGRRHFVFDEDACQLD
jgi:hypothetical protein